MSNTENSNGANQGRTNLNQPNITTNLLLKEILEHVNNVHNEISKFSDRLDVLERDVKDIKKSISTIIEDAFIDKDLKSHKKWHQKNNGGWWNKILGG